MVQCSKFSEHASIANDLLVKVIARVIGLGCNNVAVRVDKPTLLIISVAKNETPFMV